MSIARSKGTCDEANRLDRSCQIPFIWPIVSRSCQALAISSQLVLAWGQVDTDKVPGSIPGRIPIILHIVKAILGSIAALLLL